MSSPVGLVEAIKRHRDATGCSLNEAKRVVEKAYLMEEIGSAKTFYELRNLVLAIADRVL